MRLPRHLLICAALLPVFASAAEPAHTWGYDGAHGPQHWSDLQTEYGSCKLGHQQSPIDIRKTSKTALPALDFNYASAPLHIIDNGHTVQVNYAPGSKLTIDGHEYQLLQFHFHTPSEESIKGHRYPLVAHLVHRDADGKLAVVSVLFKRGKTNPLVQTVWDAIPQQKETQQEPEGVSIDIAKLLPSAHGYYNFAGSLTTPPCSEGVNWFVLKTPVEISAAQLRRFTRLYPHNARPLQPLLGRAVLESTD
jgi:carbonic anhydrase